jgi:DNA invertase Pin-like site-specific DNA recombinase
MSKNSKETIGNLRVSTVDQDLEKNKHEILELANNKDFGKVDWVEEKVSGKKNWKYRKIKDVIDNLDTGDIIIVPELSRLCRPLLEIMEMLSVSREKGVSLLSSSGSCRNLAQAPEKT